MQLAVSTLQKALFPQPMTLTLTGEAAGQVSITGNENVELPISLSATGVTAGSYTKVTVDTQGRVTVAGFVDADDLPQASILSRGVVQLVNDLVTAAEDKALTAAQGLALKTAIDNINTILMSDDTTLDQVQKIVNYIKQNRDDLQNLSIVNIAGLVDALAGKVDTVAGKQLSTEDFTTDEKSKLFNIQAGAQVNVATDLGVAGIGNTRTITSSTGSNATFSFTPADIGAPALTGEGATGTWPIEITGNAASSSVLSTQFSTTHTGSTLANQWTKVATITLSVRYSDASVTLYLKSRGNGSTSDHYDMLQFRVKQQNAFGSNPFVDLLPHVYGAQAANYGYVIVQNSPTTIVELYIQNKWGWNVVTAVELARAVTGGDISYQTSQPYLVSVPNLVEVQNRVLVNNVSLDALLGNVDNTSDATKPVSAAVAAALAGKLDIPIAVSSNITLVINKSYHVLGNRALVLPIGSPAGSKIRLTKELGSTPTISRGGAEIIRFATGTDTEIIFDINTEIIFTRNNSGEWEI